MQYFSFPHGFSIYAAFFGERMLLLKDVYPIENYPLARMSSNISSENNSLTSCKNKFSVAIANVIFKNKCNK